MVKVSSTHTPWNKGKKCPQFAKENNHFWKGGEIKTICKICSKRISVKKSVIKKGGGKYCSRECYGISKKLNMQGIKNHRFKGRIKKSDGYVFIYAPSHPFCSKQKYVYEHRLVMEKHLGRYLLPKEIVHHANGIKDDNCPENLELFSTVGNHMRFHMSFLKVKSLCNKPIITIE